MANDNVFILFEELKSMLKGIANKLEKLPKVQNGQQYEDDALKFKFIRANKGCTSKDILWLNEVFDIHRSKSDIEMIEEQVEHYNSSLKATTDSLIQMRLQENKNYKIR